MEISVRQSEDRGREVCPYCKDGFQDVEPWVCKGCGTAMHADCFNECGSCPSLGCTTKAVSWPNCPTCGVALATRGAVVCISCGFNLESGRTLAGESGGLLNRPRCGSCGARLRSRHSRICLACGDQRPGPASVRETGPATGEPARSARRVSEHIESLRSAQAESGVVWDLPGEDDDDRDDVERLLEGVDISSVLFVLMLALFLLPFVLPFYFFIPEGLVNILAFGYQPLLALLGYFYAQSRGYQRPGEIALLCLFCGPFGFLFTIALTKG